MRVVLTQYCEELTQGWERCSADEVLLEYSEEEITRSLSSLLQRPDLLDELSVVFYRSGQYNVMLAEMLKAGKMLSEFATMDPHFVLVEPAVRSLVRRRRLGDISEVRSEIEEVLQLLEESGVYEDIAQGAAR